MDQHKVMMDRYLPIYMGPLNDVDYEVAHKYSELAERQVLKYFPPHCSVV